MTRDEFKRQLDQLQEVIHRALAYYAVWKALKLHDKDTADWSLEDQNAVLGRFKGFFTPVAFAILDMALLEFAKMFDTDSKTASLRRLLAAARKDSNLVPSVSPAELRKISGELRDLDQLLVTSLTLMRNQRLAHLQAHPQAVDPVLTKDMDKLAESVTAAFNALSVGYGHNFFSFDFSLRMSERHTAEIVKILLDHQVSARRKFDDKMVNIALDELRRAELVLGGRVGRGDQRPVIQTLGLTAEQMQRVERVYNADETEAESR